MTVKRFRVIKVDDMYGVSDDLAEYTVAWDKSKLIMDNLCDLLNELHKENQALKSDRARYEEECRLDVFKELTEENEQLKNNIKEAYENERTMIGKSVLKQLIDKME